MIRPGAALLVAALAASCLPACGADRDPAGPVVGAVIQHTRPTTATDANVRAAEAIYRNETRGPKLHAQVARLAADPVLLAALAGGDLVAAQAEAHAQLFTRANHFEHVTRISVIRGSQTLVNATVNSDGVFVVAPATRALVDHGRPLGTLLVSLQDVTGFVKLVHHVTHTQVLARGASGRIRTSLPAARGVALPAAGHVTIAGHSYVVRSFHETIWGGEALTVWILE
jgi:hypothetical protein